MADQGTEGLLSSFLRSQRIKAVKPYLKGMVLDIGCGTGILAETVPTERYLGTDINKMSLQLARVLHPKHIFESEPPSSEKKFDTIVALAVIEHISDPTAFLTNLSKSLNNSTESSIVITTPHPSMEWVHAFGVNLGLFSKHANEEHEELLNELKINRIAQNCNLDVIIYQRFLFRANQLIVLKRKGKIKTAGAIRG